MLFGVKEVRIDFWILFITEADSDGIELREMKQHWTNKNFDMNFITYFKLENATFISVRVCTNTNNIHCPKDKFIVVIVCNHLFFQLFPKFFFAVFQICMKNIILPTSLQATDVFLVDYNLLLNWLCFIFRTIICPYRQ